MIKAITYSTWAIASIFVVYVFLTAQTYTQLGFAMLLYPAVVFAAFKIFSRSNPQNVHTNLEPHISLTDADNKADQNHAHIDVVDIEKRSFLKLVGTMGVAIFLSSLLGERVGNLLFGKNLVPQPQPSSPQPNTEFITDNYKITEVDEGEVSYYGFTDKVGGWLIMRDETDTSSFRYAKGGSNFPRNWAERANLKYDYFYNL